MAVIINKIGIRELKKNLSSIIDQISESGEAVTITKRGEVVAEIKPVHRMNRDEYIQKNLAGTVLRFEETCRDTEPEWHCLKENTDADA